MIAGKTKLLIFDVNETLLDLSPLRVAVNGALKNESAFDIWFQMLLHYSLVETVSLSYQDFSSMAEATLKMVSKKFKIAVPDSGLGSILGKIKELPPHKDVPHALNLLKESGFKLVAFSNGNSKVLNEQLRFAQIDIFFDGIFSVESVQKYKPHPSAYEYVLKEMQTSAKEAMMIAAHSWDVLGAKRAGMQTAFVERDGKSIYPLGEAPDLVEKTVLEIARALMQQ